MSLHVVNWSGLVGSALWICGLAVCLAALSMAQYQARAGGDRFRHRLERPEYQLALAAGLTLLCAGLLISSGTWWEKVIWGFCAAFFIVWAARSWRRRGAAREEGA